MLDLGSLNSRQREAVVHEGGPLVVFAGAGSGKTRVITYRVAHLIDAHDIAPWRVLAVTFTNKAAGEMRDRLLSLLGDRGASVYVGTFHAMCARFLRRFGDTLGVTSGFTIYDDQDQVALIKRVLRDLSLDEKRYQPRAIAGRINRAKQEVQGPDQIATPDPWTEVVRGVLRDLRGAPRASQCLGFRRSDLSHRAGAGSWRRFPCGPRGSILPRPGRRVPRHESSAVSDSFGPWLRSTGTFAWSETTTKASTVGEGRTGETSWTSAPRFRAPRW